MAMTGPPGDELPGDDALMSEINMTPLVDVMLVLLIVFLVTIPALQHALKIDLPRVASQPERIVAPHADVAIDANGVVLWNGERVTMDDLDAKLAAAAAMHPQPELRVHADRNVRYERVADVMSAAQAAGIAQLGFVTEPRPRPVR
ncbi:ExbD/TolR family protein [Paraburkholderia caballeronis]|uniref:ExbD/TolR family protein n=1 Tax=Paraburkholderia caballeronis TaxID=416943 RepID=UPI0010669D57|nr:biopolymer transporter ExbD [Paraburkholderia caballeronis]TDV19508.1 biopolymer transport protein ExbD [Paraburkholderia caballeronis]TDV22108.1 biopolymer transport protein ExbD [Paraburkholderia caballeronis]TDV29012.1 biopolymer transport protein ExbD [Paraburkholderia caballeronis]